MSCHAEHKECGGHDHGDGHGHHHDHGHDHSHEPEDADGDSLFPYIDRDNIWALNESSADAAKQCFRPYSEKHARDKFVTSEEDDPELMIHVPFTAAVKIKSVCIIGGPGGAAPSEVKIFANREDLDFATANDMPPTQRLELQENAEGEIDYPVKASKFLNVSSVTLFFPENFGASQTQVMYIGFKGEGTQVVECVYEARPIPEAHSVGAGTESMSRELH